MGEGLSAEITIKFEKNDIEMALSIGMNNFIG